MLNNLLVVLNNPVLTLVFAIIIGCAICGILFLLDHITKKDISEVVFNGLMLSVCIFSFVFCTFVLFTL